MDNIPYVDVTTRTVTCFSDELLYVKYKATAWCVCSTFPGKSRSLEMYKTKQQKTQYTQCGITVVVSRVVQHNVHEFIFLFFVTSGKYIRSCRNCITFYKKVVHTAIHSQITIRSCNTLSELCLVFMLRTKRINLHRKGTPGSAAYTHIPCVVIGCYTYFKLRVVYIT